MKYQIVQFSVSIVHIPSCAAFVLGPSSNIGSFFSLHAQCIDYKKEQYVTNPCQKAERDQFTA